MPEQLLHRAEVGASIEQVRGERMAQGMWVRRFGCAAVEDPPDVPGAQRPTPLVPEQGVAVGGVGLARRGPAGADRRRVRLAIAPQGLHRRG